MSTKIDIISGFLGAGKTTLIKKLIKEALQNEKMVLIENEFGEIGIDGGFLQESGIQITEMNSGCICCSLVGDFGTALEEVINTYYPDRIVIEPSGVGKLSDVIKAVNDVAVKNDIILNSYTVVADAKKSKMYMKNFGEFYNNQIQHARTIILSRSSDVSEEKLNQCVESMRQLNADAVIITTPWDALDGKDILKEMEKRQSIEEKVFEEEVCHVCGHEHHNEHEHNDTCGCGHEHHHDETCGCGHDHHEGHHHADDVFNSWGVETPTKLSKADIESILETLSETDEYGMILRAKGMMPDQDGNWNYFDFVPGEYEIRDGLPQVTGRICVIGSNLDQTKLDELFHIS